MLPPCPTKTHWLPLIIVWCCFFWVCGCRDVSYLAYMFGEWLDVVSLLELSVCHYIWTSFMSIFFIYVDFESNHSQDGLEWEMVQLYVFYSCCWFLCHQDNYLQPNVLYVSLFVYRVLLLVHLYKYRYMYWSKDIHVDKCKNCLHRNWSIRAFVFSKNILQGKKNFMYVWMFMYICFLENLL